jgi:hypothetical protein
MSRRAKGEGSLLLLKGCSIYCAQFLPEWQAGSGFNRQASKTGSTGGTAALDGPFRHRADANHGTEKDQVRATALRG